MFIKRFKCFRSRQGSILLFTLFILVLLSLLGTGFLFLIPVEMRNAQHDRAIVQAGYGADAALRVVLDKLYYDTPWQAIASEPPEVITGEWKYAVEKIEEIEEGTYRVTTVGLLRNKVKRRAVAIVDDGAGKFALRFASSNLNGTQQVNSEGAWPVTVPIRGDVFIQGTWYVDNTGLDLDAPNNDRPFKGVIFQTDATGGGLRGEQYEGTTPTSPSQYASMYDWGIDAIQPYDKSRLTEQDLFIRDDVNTNLLEYTFGVSGQAQLTQAKNQVSGAVHVPDANGDGVMDGGVFIPSDADAVTYSYDPTLGIGTTEIDNGAQVITLRSRKGTFSDTPETPDSLEVSVSGQSTSQTYRFNSNEGIVTYVDGEVFSVSGTYTGSQTLAAARAITITGELLKSDTPRGEEPDESTDTLGLIACVDGGSNDYGMSVDMKSIPPDNHYYVYAHITALSHNDQSAKMFSRSQHPELPLGTTFTLFGSLAWAPTTAGQINTSIDFIESWEEVVLDSHRPLGFPGGGKYIPRVRSYVDIPVGS